MATFVILSRISPQAFEDPKDFKDMAKTVSHCFSQWEQPGCGSQLQDTRHGAGRPRSGANFLGE